MGADTDDLADVVGRAPTLTAELVERLRALLPVPKEPERAAA
jgi:hypothetical protein